MIDTIVNSFDIWVHAQGIKSRTRVNSVENISLEGISRLRELILELAVRGKLVSQDPKEEPAIELIKKIEKAKEKLINEGKIKKQALLSKFTEDEIPFEVPKSWEWVGLQSLSIYIQRGKGPRYSLDGKVQVVSQKCIQWSGFNLSLAKYIDDLSISDYQPERFLVDDDLLWNSTGTGTVGRINVLKCIKSNTLVADSHVTVIRPIFINSSFLCKYLASPSIQKRIEPGSKNALVSGSTNQVELNTSSVNSVLIPLPPLEEQHRIVAKVDELMALCDKLEAEQFNNLKTHQALVKTLLETLTQAADANELQAAWERMSAHFDTLFCTEDSIAQLKQTILQLAVMGKLVKQDPNDEPASALLKKIAISKKKLIKDGKIKKQDSLPEILSKEMPYLVPNNWEWCRLGEISLISRGSSPRPKGDPRYFSNEVTEFNWITISDITNFCKKNVLYKTREYLTKEGAPLSRYVDKDEFIIAVSGSTTGKCCITGIPGYIYDGLASVNFIDKAISNEYFLLYMMQYYQYINTSVEGLFPNINTDFLKNLQVCIPPYSEQNRIVSKVDELFALCEALSIKIRNSQELKVLLSKTIIEKSVQ